MHDKRRTMCDRGTDTGFSILDVSAEVPKLVTRGRYKIGLTGGCEDKTFFGLQLQTPTSMLHNVYNNLYNN